ncbi:SCP family extracellular subfamily protein [Cardiosporidium cionae]|uniref:SCP family extracellular subfamily protein n=1 Tax=Cardiosporidium cionae TaxID=476202 RepID=A0ABQ7JC10_9APIC|nr:SCP family extracellular subfamily protein [Cardiosporidium cionae]|eukprot:KAF8821494.1 SCP family extracellular subfamily protein [Cardiosporidium cionae]
MKIVFILLSALFLLRFSITVAFTDLMDYGKSGNIHRQRILDMHNMLRSYEAGNAWGGGAVYMLRLVYDMGLEKYAKNYASKLCATGHWGHSKRSPPDRVAPGENLYVNTIDYSNKGETAFDASIIVKKWWDERKYFDWNAKDPAAKATRMGQMIGHYTQIVRAEASAVGCWIVTGCQCGGNRPCRKENNPPYWSTYMACHYDFGNQGWFPYWPVAIPSKIPKSVSPGRRRRCGNCPRGYGVCGTTAGYLNPKRDAYLCSGFWDKAKPLPPANLLSQSINKRRKSGGVPSWSYVIRHCASNNDGCPRGRFGNSQCWAYNNGKPPPKEPSILFQQCICNNFSTTTGVWFQRDTCAIINSLNAQPLARYGVFSTISMKDAAQNETAANSTRPSEEDVLRLKEMAHMKLAQQRSENETELIVPPEALIESRPLSLDVDQLLWESPYEDNEKISDNAGSTMLNIQRISNEKNTEALLLDSIGTPDKGTYELLFELQNKNYLTGALHAMLQKDLLIQPHSQFKLEAPISTKSNTAVEKKTANKRVEEHSSDNYDQRNPRFKRAKQNAMTSSPDFDKTAANRPEIIDSVHHYSESKVLNATMDIPGNTHDSSEEEQFPPELEIDQDLTDDYPQVPILAPIGNLKAPIEKNLEKTVTSAKTRRKIGTRYSFSPTLTYKKIGQF